MDDTAPLIEVKYNNICQLGILNGDRVRLIEVKSTENRGTNFWEFEKCPFNRGRLLNRGPLNRGLTVKWKRRRHTCPFAQPTVLQRLLRVEGLLERIQSDQYVWNHCPSDFMI